MCEISNFVKEIRSYLRAHTRAIDSIKLSHILCARERIRESESLRASFLLESVASQLV